MAARPLRDYQIAAVDAVTRALADGGSGQLHMACGTGKSLTAQRITETLLAPMAGDRCAVVAVITPSLTLVKQFLDSWNANAELGPVNCLAVCSDQTVSEADAAARLSEIDALVTTSPAVISDRLRQLPSSGLLLIVSTYASVHRLADGLRGAGAVLDLMVCDEAHHLAGKPSKYLRQLVTERAWLPTRRRVFMTATPRLYTANATERGALSMDDHDLFGGVTFSYAFPQAIADGHLDDYRALVTVVEDDDVRKVLESLNDQTEHEGEEGRREVRNTVVAQVALLRSWQEQGVGRAIAFCDSIRGSKQFTAQLPTVAAALGYDPSQIQALHVDGSMRSEQREPILAQLAAAPDGRLVVVSNARCLSEGVDVPSVDAVLFACPKRSEVDIIQSAGRALRRGPGGRGVAKFILPILLPEAANGVLDQSVLTGTDYEPTWTVIRALRDIDSDLGAALDRARSAQGIRTNSGQEAAWEDLPKKIVVSGAVPTPALLRQIAVAMLERTTSPWLDGYSALKKFHARHGHTHVPSNAWLADGTTLRSWTKRQRRDYAKGKLTAAQVEALQELDFMWDTEGAEWQVKLHAYQKLKPKEGDRTWLGDWVRAQRDAHSNGTLAAERVAALNAAGFDWLPVPEHIRAERERAKTHLEVEEAVMLWLAASGTIDVPAEATVRLASGGERQVRRALDACCGLLGAGLSEEVESALNDHGFDWLPSDWRENFGKAAAFHAENGHFNIPEKITGVLYGTEQPLIDWLRTERSRGNEGRLSPACAIALNRIGVSWSPGQWSQHDEESAWLRMTTIAARYWARNGVLSSVPLNYRMQGSTSSYTTFDTYLGCWLQIQRQRRRDGALPEGWDELLEALGIGWDIDWPALDPIEQAA